jgi:serine/threonine protein kinase
MATLYLARTSGVGRFERLFAIKVTHDHLSKERGFVEMFMNEARIAAKIQHPNVIPVYEIDHERGRYYMVMDYVSGETLALALKHTWNKDRPFPLASAAHLIATACEGLHAAHELRGPDGPLGVVHRDVAPQNLMIGYDGIVRVMDFGIAKALDTVSMTKPGVMKGTIAYMAPEQVKCQPIDRRVDVFALGAILWEASVGMRLFRHKNDVTTAARVVKMQIPPPSTLRKGYPAELERIVMRALQRDKEQRYQTARDMGEDLQEFLHKTGERVTPAVLGAFMLDVFPERARQRRTLELEAREEEPPPGLGQLPADSTGDSLGIVNENENVELDDLDGPVAFQAHAAAAQKFSEESSAIPLPPSVAPAASAAVPVDPELQRKIPTLVVRERSERSRAPVVIVTPAEPRPDADAGADLGRAFDSMFAPAPAPAAEPRGDLGAAVVEEEWVGVAKTSPKAEARAEPAPEGTKKIEVDLPSTRDLLGPRRTMGWVGAAALFAVAVAVAIGGQDDPKPLEPVVHADPPKAIVPPVPDEPPVPAESPPPVEAQLPVEPPPVEAAKVTLRFDVTPADTEVYVNGNLHVGDLVVAASDQDRYVIRASRTGFETQTTVVGAEGDHTVRIVMKPMAAKTAPVRPRPKRTVEAPARKKAPEPEKAPEKAPPEKPPPQKKAPVLFGGDDI